MDFDDLLLLTVRLFTEFPEILQKQQAKFDHVQIDEYQDTNGVQFQLIERLVAGHHNLCVVGDDDQSIYGWRGAEIEHIINFASHFPGTKTIRLENNYRCTDEILGCANRLVRHNRHRHDKTLIAHKKGGSPIRVLTYDDETAEAENVVLEIGYLISELGVKPKQVAILFRTNEQPRVFEQELRRLKVPYVLVGGQSFFDRREIRDLLGYLKAIASPKDEISLLRIINTPTRGIGATTVEKMIQLAVRKGASFWEILPEAQAAGIVPAKTMASLRAFQSLLDRYAVQMKESPRQLAEITRRLLKEIDYESEIVKQYKEQVQQDVRKNVLEEFVNSIGQYVEKETEPTLSGFLESTALMDREEQSDKDEQLSDNSVRLMTLHSAKGLEFPIVYMIGMEEGVLPHRRSISGEIDSVDEERRLCYVGVTRAQDELTLSLPQSRFKWGKPRPTYPSRFLYELTGQGDHPNRIKSIQAAAQEAKKSGRTKR